MNLTIDDIKDILQSENIDHQQLKMINLGTFFDIKHQAK